MLQPFVGLDGFSFFRFFVIVSSFGDTLNHYNTEGGWGGFGAGTIWYGRIRCGAILVQNLKSHEKMWYKISR